MTSKQKVASFAVKATQGVTHSLLSFSPPPPKLSPFPARSPLPVEASIRLKLLCDCQHRQSTCPSVLLSVFLLVCLSSLPRASLLGTELSCWQEHAGSLWAPSTALVGGVIETKTKEKKWQKKKYLILVVSNWICFPWFSLTVLKKHVAKQLPLAWESSCFYRCGQKLRTSSLQNQPIVWRTAYGTCIVFKYFTWSKYTDNKKWKC